MVQGMGKGMVWGMEKGLVKGMGQGMIYGMGQGTVKRMKKVIKNQALFLFLIFRKRVVQKRGLGNGLKDK